MITILHTAGLLPQCVAATTLTFKAKTDRALRLAAEESGAAAHQ